MRTFVALVALLLGALQPAHAFDVEYDHTVDMTPHCVYDAQSDDDFLWDLYWETPKIDKTGNFLWKDPVSAVRAGMDMKTWVVRGVHPTFRRQLAAMLRVAQMAGHNPGSTSLFRDDYRQSLIKSGKRSAVGHSQHGNSAWGGYGYGTAADIVSLNGDTRREQYEHNKALWDWIDQNGRMFGIIRPIKNDPMHVVPLRPLVAMAKAKPSTSIKLAKAKKPSKKVQIAKVKKPKEKKKVKVALAH